MCVILSVVLQLCAYVVYETNDQKPVSTNRLASCELQAKPYECITKLTRNAIEIILIRNFPNRNSRKCTSIVFQSLNVCVCVCVHFRPMYEFFCFDRNQVSNDLDQRAFTITVSVQEEEEPEVVEKNAQDWERDRRKTTMYM